MVHQDQARYGAKITTVDSSTGYVGVVMNGDAQERQVLHASHTVASRWPVPGENWIVVQRNGTWYLESVFSSGINDVIPPGDVILDSPTGVVHVHGHPEGTTDFAFTQDSFTLDGMGIARGNNHVTFSASQNTTALISHGLSNTPTSVMATPTAVLPSYSLSLSTINYTSSHFTIAARAGSSNSDTIPFAWIAVI